MSKFYSEKNKSEGIGTSLAFCVRDIVAGRYGIDDVKAIIAGTEFRSAEEIIEKYKETYWANFPEEASTVCRELWNRGKIIQPCLKDPKAIIFVKRVWYNNLDSLIESQLDAGRYNVANNLRELALA